jgi:transcription factor E
MQKDFLKMIANELGGQTAEGVVNTLYGKKQVNEQIIAKKLKLNINQTRNILYRMCDEGLVSFVRKKDGKKGGWYVYYWKLEVGKSLLKMQESLSEKIERLQGKLEEQRNERFFVCKSCDLEFDEEHALLGDYHCSECGELLELKDSTEDITEIGKELEEMNKVLENVNKEVEEFEKQEGKKRLRKAKVEEKKREEKRIAQRKERQKKLKKESKGKKKNTKAKKKKKKSVKRIKKKSIKKIVKKAIRRIVGKRRK